MQPAVHRRVEGNTTKDFPMAFRYAHFHPLASLLAAAALLGGCTSDGDNDVTFDDASGTDTMGSATDGGNDGGDRGDGGDGGSDGGVEEQGPHARGIVVLGESHAPKASTSSPIVTATFVPDYHAQPAACGEQVAGCFVQTPPDCGGLCDFDEYCAFDEGCEAKCMRTCDLACAADEVCYFPIPENPACKKVEHFDAGALNFTGTTVPITLFPPYVFQGNVTGALYLPDSDITVHGSGTTGAGFESFEESFRTTSYLRTQIDEIGLPELYGSGPLPVTWTAGSDDVRIQLTVSGLSASYGMITCEADDSAGSFGVPREAILSVLEPNEELGGISVSVERRRSELRKGLSTTGQLLDQIVQPEGWLELVSTSVESITLTGCGGQAYCGGECIDVQWNDDHCGSCNNACSAIEACYAGTCESNCAWNETACGNVCVDTDTSTAHCGGCNMPCGAGQTCSFGTCSGGGGDDGGNAGTCCTAQATPGCSDAVVQNCVCASDSYCCNTAWDSTCVSQVTTLGCGTC
jgi:hypothetical protein